MARTKLMIYTLCLCTILAGCSSIEPTLKTHSLEPRGAFSPEKLTYDATRRVMLYEGKAVWFHGKKVASRRLAEEILSSMKETARYPSFGSAAAESAGMALLVPVGIVSAVAGMPGLSLIDLGARLEGRESFELLLKQGEKLLSEKRYPEARQLLLKALYYTDELGSASHIHYDLARSYDGENLTEPALFHYRMFLEKALDLYPVRYWEYDSAFANNLETLSSEFAEAERKLGGVVSKENP